MNKLLQTKYCLKRFLIYIVILIPFFTSAQINVLNIGNGSGSRGDQLEGYTLDGSGIRMTCVPKLYNPDLFGPDGIVKERLAITSDYSTLHSITSLDQLQPYDIIFIGTFGYGNGAFSPEEIALLQEWSQQPGKVLLMMEQPIGFPMTASMGYNLIESLANPTTAAPDDATITNIFTGGPFGQVNSIDQAGSSQGSFELPCGSKVLGINSLGNPSIVFDPYYRDILLADIGYFQVSGMEADNTANTDAEKTWCNIWAWAIKEVKAKTMPIVLPPSTKPLGTAIWNGPGQLPLCGTNTSGSVNVSDTLKGFQLLGWQTSTNGGSSWQDVGDQKAIYSFSSVANGTMFRFVSGPDTTRGASCKLYFSNPVTMVVNNYQQNSQTYEMCEGGTYMGHSQAGIYRDTVSQAGVCSINILSIVIKTKKDSAFSATICEGETYEGYNKSGIYKNTFEGTNGCDSVRTLTLTVNKKRYSTISQSICEGESYLSYNATGTYLDTLVATNGCDSIRTLRLWILPRPHSTIAQSICPGQQYLGYHTSGVFVDTLLAANGCDSIRTLYLTVKPVNASSVSQTICKGQSYLGYSNEGIYLDTLVATDGCDSIRTLTLKVNGPPQPYLVSCQIDYVC